MQIYALKMFNFFRFSDKNNCIIFDVLPEYKGMSMDDLYVKIKKNPFEHISKVKQCGVTNLTTIAGFTNGNYDFSNGVGKSTCLEAICYVLFEQIVRHTANTEKIEKVTKTIITNINGEYPQDVDEGWVEMIFEENDEIYVLKRGRELLKNKTEHKRILKFDCIDKNGGIDSRSGHRTCDTDESICKVVNMSYDLFVNSILFGQMDMGKFLSGTDQTRKEMLIELLRFDSLINGMLKNVRDKKNLKEKELDKYNSQMALIAEELQKKPTVESLNKQILEKENLIKECIASTEKSREELNTLLQSDTIKEMENIKVEGAKIKADLSGKKSDKENRTQEWTKLSSDVDKSISDKSNEIELSKTKKNEISKKIGAIQKQIESFNMEEKKKGLETIEKAKIARPKYSDKIKDLLNTKEKSYGNISSLESDIKRYSKEIDSLNKQIECGQEQFVCDKCKSMVSKKHIEGEIEKNAKDKERAEAEILKHREEQNKIVEDLKKSQETMEKISGWINKEGQINSEIKDFNNNKERVKELEASDKELFLNIHKLSVDKKELDEKKSHYVLKIEEIGKTFDSEINALVVKLKELSNRYQELNKSSVEIKTKIDEIKKLIEEKSQTKSTYNSQIGSLKKEIEIIGDDNKKLTELKNKHDLEKLVLVRMNHLETCLGLGGIQIRIIQKYLPLLNVYIEEFMSLISGGNMGVKIVINEKGKVDVVIRGGSANSYEMLSGGEKTTCKLAVSVALALLSFTRCNHKPEFIAIDEAFGNLDKSHVEMAFKLLDRLKDKFARILVISHSVEINNRIPHRILVEKDEGMFGRSRIKEIT